MIEKKDLKHGSYYKGVCRNAGEARWNAETQRFYHWRTKFRSTFIEEIFHPEDDNVYDVFRPDTELPCPTEYIPL